MCRNGRQSALGVFFPMKPENFHGLSGAAIQTAGKGNALPVANLARIGRNPTPTRHNPVMPKVIIFSKFILLIGLMSGFLRVSRSSKVCFREKPAARSTKATVRGQDLSGERRALCVGTPGLFSHRRVLRGEVTRRCYFGPDRCGPLFFSPQIPAPLKNPGTDSVYGPYRLEPERTCRSGPPPSLPFRSPP